MRGLERGVWGSGPGSHLQLLGVADAIVQNIDLQRQEGDSGTAGGTGPLTPYPAPAQPGLQQRWVSPHISAASSSPSGQTSRTPNGGSSPTVPGPSPWQGRRAVMEGSQARP